MMHASDIRQAADVAHRYGAILIVDNTFMTPYFQNPLDLGAILSYTAAQNIWADIMIPWQDFWSQLLPNCLKNSAICTKPLDPVWLLLTAG